MWIDSFKHLPFVLHCVHGGCWVPLHTFEGKTNIWNCGQNWQKCKGVSQGFFLGWSSDVFEFHPQQFFPSSWTPYNPEWISESKLFFVMLVGCGIQFQITTPFNVERLIQTPIICVPLWSWYYWIPCTRLKETILHPFHFAPIHDLEPMPPFVHS